MSAPVDLYLNQSILLKKDGYKLFCPLQYPDGRVIPGVFGTGVAFPKQIQAISGEIEFAVGVGKFWTSLSEDILHQWRL